MCKLKPVLHLKTPTDLPLCRDLSSNRLVAIPPNLFLSLEDLLQLWVLFAQIGTRIHSSECENSSVNVLLVSYKPWDFRSSAVPWLQLKLNFNRFYLHKYNCAHTCILHTCKIYLCRISILMLVYVYIIYTF